MATLTKKKAKKKLTKKKVKKTRPISPNRMKYNRLHGLLPPPKLAVDPARNPAWYQALSEGASVIATDDLASETDVEEGEIGTVCEILRDDETGEITRIKVRFVPSQEVIPFDAGEHMIGDELLQVPA
jgi:hypothetical protein